jgi:hypothetical protein
MKTSKKTLTITMVMAMFFLVGTIALADASSYGSNHGMNGGYGSGYMMDGDHNNPMGPVGPTPGYGPTTGPQMPANLVWQFPSQPISEEERVGLIQMRQEMKLARDVYLALYNKWQHQVFSHIAQAEQRHMDAVGGLLGKYGIADPIVDNTPGAFSDQHLNDLYQSLVAKGATSQENALLVGATIEDMDIYDLNELTAQTDNDDIDAVYQNLEIAKRKVKDSLNES